MISKLAVLPVQMEMIQAIFRQFLPSAGTVYVFGSRIKGTAKPFSDLDLAIDLGSPIPLSLLAKLAEAFDESSLPFKVDLVDWQTIDQTFRDHIESDRYQIFPLNSREGNP